MGLRVVINQSNYLPWKGYFDLIHDADVFIFHDDLQYTKNDWRNRNRLKTPRGPQWLTIPVGTSEHRLINEVFLPADHTWRTKHWRVIEQNYRDTPYFNLYAPFCREVYLGKMRWRTLAELNQFLLSTIAREFLGIRTEFVDSARFRVMAKKQDRVIALLKAVGATTYISGPAAKAYLDPAKLSAEGIELVWKDYSGYPEYPQPFPPFEPAVFILDLLFGTGSTAPDFIWGWRERAVSPDKP